MENDERASLIKNNYDNSVAYSLDDGSSSSNIDSNNIIDTTDKNYSNNSFVNSGGGSINNYYNLIKPPSITSSPLHKPQHYRNNNNKINNNINNNNNHNNNQEQQEQHQQEQQEKNQQHEHEQHELHDQEQINNQKPNVFQRIWELFFSLSNDNENIENNNHNNRRGENNNNDNNNNDKRSRSNSCIGYVDENQKYICQQNNNNYNNNDNESSSSSSSSSSKSKEENNNIIINNNNNKLNINNDDQDQQEIDKANRIYDLFFSLSITQDDEEESNKTVNKTNNKNNNKSNNTIKYNELKIEDKQEQPQQQHDKNDNNNNNKDSQKSTENIIQPSQQQQQKQEQQEQQQQIIQTTPKFKREDTKTLFEKSPFFEPIRPVIDFNDPILLEPIESKLPGNLEKNKYLYENIKPSPIPLSVLLTGLTVCDLEGNQILVTNLYKNKRVVVAIFRRFGCLICRLQALDLSSLKPKLDKLGIDLIGIGFDEDGLEEFMQLNFFAGKIYLDKTRSIYRALNLKRRSKLTTYELFLDPRVMVYYRRLKELGLSANYRKDGFQLGATLVLGPLPIEALYDFRPQRYADIFDLKEIWEACQKPYPSESEILAARKIDISIPKPVTLVCDNNIKFDLSVYKPKSTDSATNNSSKKSTINQQEYHEDEEYDQDEEYDEDEEYDGKDNNGSIYSDDDDQYEDSYDEYEEDEEYDDELEGVKLPKPSKNSKILSSLLDSIQVDPSLFKTDGIQIYTVPSLELEQEPNDSESVSSSKPSGTITQEQEYFDKLNNANYINKNFYKVSKSSKFILRGDDDDEFENPLIYCPYKYNGD